MNHTITASSERQHHTVTLGTEASIFMGKNSEVHFTYPFLFVAKLNSNCWNI